MDRLQEQNDDTRSLKQLFAEGCDDPDGFLNIAAVMYLRMSMSEAFDFDRFLQRIFRIYPDIARSKGWDNGGLVDMINAEDLMAAVERLRLANEGSKSES